MTTSSRSPHQGPVSIVVGANAPALRRGIGALGWAVLEHLVATSTTGRDGRPTVEAPVRDVARELGVAKNTALRALQRLAEAGVIEAEHGRRADGAYQPTRYRIHLPDDTVSRTARSTRTTRRATTKSKPADTTVEAAQLSLLGTP